MTALLKTASKQWDVLRHAWNDVLRDANEDSVHELRVASRRILSCLSLVDSILLANHRSKARRKIKRLMKKLGPLRDVQVQTSISRSWPRTKAPLGFQEYLKRRIVTKSKAVQSYLTDKRKRAIRGSLKDAELDARRSLQDLSPELVRSRLSSALESQRDEFHAAKAAAKSQDRKKVHRLRVAAKRLPGRGQDPASVSALSVRQQSCREHTSHHHPTDSSHETSNLPSCASSEVAMVKTSLRFC